MKQKLAKDVAFVPFFYEVGWARDLNRLLAQTFSTPFRISQYKGHKHRMAYHAWISRLHSWMHDNRDRVKGIFYTNLNLDFAWSVALEAPHVKHWGICHGTMYPQAGAPTERQFEAFQRPKSWLTYEKGIYEVAQPPFVASEVMARSIADYPTAVVGLPLFGHPGKPSVEKGILWNHRLSGYKHPEMLLDTSRKVRERVIVSSPGTGGGSMITEVRNSVGEFWAKPSQEQYADNIRRSGYVLSFNSHETFGYSVFESVWAGLFALCPDWEYVPYREYLPTEMLVSHPSEIEERVRHYDDHPTERDTVVLQAQKALAHLQSDRWMAAVLDKMGVEA